MRVCAGHAGHLLRIDLLLVPGDVHVLDACDSDACARQHVGIRCHGVADRLDLSDLGLQEGKGQAARRERRALEIRQGECSGVGWRALTAKPSE